MFVYTYIRMYVYIYIYIQLYIYAYMCVNTYIFIYKNVNLLIQICTYEDLCQDSFLCATWLGHTCERLHVCVYIIYL